MTNRGQKPIRSCIKMYRLHTLSKVPGRGLFLEDERSPCVLIDISTPPTQASKQISKNKDQLITGVIDLDMNDKPNSPLEWFDVDFCVLAPIESLVCLITCKAQCTITGHQCR